MTGNADENSKNFPRHPYFQKRLILARQKILQGEKPTDIFAQYGYQDYSTFYRAYLRFFGHRHKQENKAFPVSSVLDRIDLIR